MKVTRVKTRELAQRMVFESIFPCARSFVHFATDSDRGIYVVLEWDWSEESEYVDSERELETNQGWQEYPTPVGECDNPVHTIPLTDNEAVVCFACGGTRNV